MHGAANIFHTESENIDGIFKKSLLITFCVIFQFLVREIYKEEKRAVTK